MFDFIINEVKSFLWFPRRPNPFWATICDWWLFSGNHLCCSTNDFLLFLTDL